MVNSQKICKFRQLENRKKRVFRKMVSVKLFQVCSPTARHPIYIISFGSGHLHQGQRQSVLKISLATTGNYFLVMAPKR